MSGSSSSSSRSAVIGMQISPRPCVAMKLIDFGRDLLGRDRQVSLVLPVLVIHHDDHLAGANGGNRLLDRGEGPCERLAIRIFGLFVGSSWS